MILFDGMKLIDGGVCAAKGFAASGIAAGIKSGASSGNKDVALICCEKVCNAAAVFTTNKVKGAPVRVSMRNVNDGKLQAVIANSGNSNVCTSDGLEVAEGMCAITANALKIAKENVLVASTGVIGQNLPIEPFKTAIPHLARQLNYSCVGSKSAAEAIMTTDTFPKEFAVEFELDGKVCRIGGIAKGSGMINPNMATLLSFITTDVNVSAEVLRKALVEINEETFNMVSVDGDTSTSDTVCIMASGLAGNTEIIADCEDYQTFCTALCMVMNNLATSLVRDGEGATKLITCNVRTAPDMKTARAVAKSIVSSSLVKAALGAADANWGRILCAIGYADTDTEFDVSKIDVTLIAPGAMIPVCVGGIGVAFSEDEAYKALQNNEIFIAVEMNSGSEAAVAWGCDLTEEYVRINADYRS